MQPASADPARAGLVVEGLRVDGVRSRVDIVSGIDLAVGRGRAVGVVGESGSGKTTVGMALLGYARPGTRIVGGSVRVAGVDLLALRAGALRENRGRLISFVPQNPGRSLSPGMRIGRQLAEVLEGTVEGGAARLDRISAAFDAAQLPNDKAFLDRYPHQLSGGQQQRVAIAMALVAQPEVIVMDEPTTGLDVITQARLVDVIRKLRTDNDATIVYISHDLGVVRNLVDSVAVMYGGRLVEEGPVDEIFRQPRHPYTRRLLEAIPRLHGPLRTLRGIPGSAVEPRNRPAGCVFAPRCEFRSERCDAEMPPVEVDGTRLLRCWNWPDAERAGVPAPAANGAVLRDRRAAEPLLVVDSLAAGYGRSARLLGIELGAEPSSLAVAGVSLELREGACLAVVGESGSGKTTLARAIAGLHKPSGGEIRFRGQRLAPTAARRDADVRRRIQIVFQDPDSSLNPRLTAGQSVARPLRQFFGLGRGERTRRAADLLERVRLPAAYLSAYPRELSGGEKQRVALARALAAEPELLICDEVTSALDVAVQASILELLEELRETLRMSLLFISHDLAVVRTISDDVIVMRDGVVREVAATEAVYAAASDPYARELLAAVPDLRPDDYPSLDYQTSAPRSS